MTLTTEAPDLAPNELKSCPVCKQIDCSWGGIPANCSLWVKNPIESQYPVERVAELQLAAIQPKVSDDPAPSEYERGYFDGEAKWAEAVDAKDAEIARLREVLEWLQDNQLCGLVKREEVVSAALKGQADDQ